MRESSNAPQVPAPIDDREVRAAMFESKALTDVAAERRRQVEAEEWREDHDDEHGDYSLARAGACYALAASYGDFFRDLRTPNDNGKLLREWQGSQYTELRSLWPWDWKWWKPKDRRRDLVRAGALILAEIERLDRAALRGEAP